MNVATTIITKARNYWLSHQQPADIFYTKNSLQLPVLPSAFGTLCIVVMLIIFFCSVNYQLNLGYALFFLFSALAALSAVATTSVLSHLHIHLSSSEPIFAGEDAYFPIQIKKTSKRAFSGCWVGISSTNKIWIASEGKRLLKQKFIQRGVYSLSPLTLWSTYPFGLCVVWQWLNPSVKVVVYPKPAGSAPLPFSEKQATGTKTVNVSGSEDFMGLASYQKGELLSKVAWKQSTRGTWMMKKFADTAALQVVLDYQMLSGNKEQRLQQLCQWIVSCEAQDIAYELILPTQHLAMQSGAVHKHKCLYALALA